MSVPLAERVHEVRLDPTNAVIVSKADGKIIRNGVHQRCPHCGAALMHNHATVPIWNVGAVGRWECCKCRLKYNVLTIPVPVGYTPEEFYEKILNKVFFEE